MVSALFTNESPNRTPTKRRYRRVLGRLLGKTETWAYMIRVRRIRSTGLGISAEILRRRALVGRTCTISKGPILLILSASMTTWGESLLVMPPDFKKSQGNQKEFVFAGASWKLPSTAWCFDSTERALSPTAAGACRTSQSAAPSAVFFCLPFGGSTRPARA